ncbi:MAG: nitroreductase family protein [Candidatus Marinimicrobia bacterium]|nr:nitroreductase family protein [Candidatus Neomarinimicrobiota bacterium]MCF7904530.1 nitroreductase family protein [Candidatus Neomarinimicrobiota bacterium]
MSIYELIRSRVSIRDYDPALPVEEGTLERILDAGRLAPSAYNRQPWTFLLISSDEMLARVRPCYQKEWFQNAPHILIIIGHKDKSWVRTHDGYNSLETDLAIAMDHIILAATSEDVGTCWIAAYDPQMLAEAIELQENEVIGCITPLGYPHESYNSQRPKQRKSLDDIARII